MTHHSYFYFPRPHHIRFPRPVRRDVAGQGGAGEALAVVQRNRDAWGLAT